MSTGLQGNSGLELRKLSSRLYKKEFSGKPKDNKGDQKKKKVRILKETELSPKLQQINTAQLLTKLT